ncbi:glycine betaine ABC transporter substrate-binding protein [Aeromicrobium sp.]|uniref:ABC transporter substrate-binding protein n=1 Tax=Aeromicrobium sp. TaxID=1871063 RepID=UPI003D6C009D
MKTRLTAVLAVAALGLGLSACGGDPTEGEKAATDTITVGSADFPENEIIAEIYAQALEAKDIKVEKKLKIGAREVYLPALENGEIDLLPEYTGNLLLYLDKEATATSPDDVTAALGDAVPENTEILDVAEAEDKDSLNVTSEFSEQEGITTIADLKKIDGLKVGASPEFKERPYGLPGMEKVYGITGVEFTAIADAGGPATLKALLDGKVDVANIYSTTPSIVENDLVTLEDPENMIASQNVVPLINSDKASDEVKEVLNAISAELTTEDLLDLNGQNQGEDKVAPAELAKQWLTDKGLI